MAATKEVFDAMHRLGPCFTMEMCQREPCRCAADIAADLAKVAPLPEIGPASIELLARVMCKADGDDPDRYWQDYRVSAEAAAEWFRDFMANS